MQRKWSDSKCNSDLQSCRILYKLPFASKKYSWRLSPPWPKVNWENQRGDTHLVLAFAFLEELFHSIHSLLEPLAFINFYHFLFVGMVRLQLLHFDPSTVRRYQNSICQAKKISITPRKKLYSAQPSQQAKSWAPFVPAGLKHLLSQLKRSTDFP